MIVSFSLARTIGLSLLVFVIVIMGLFFVSITERISDQVYRDLELRVTQIERLERMKDLFDRVYKSYTDYITDNIDDSQIIITSIDQLIEESKYLKEAVAYEDKESVDVIIKNSQRLKMTVDFYSNEAKEDPMGTSAMDAGKALKESQILLDISLINLRKNIEDKQEVLDKSMLNAAQNGQKVAWIVIVVGIITGLFSAFFMGHASSVPIRQLVHGTQRLAEGDLAYRVKVKSSDEIGQLAISFNKMAENIKYLLEKEKEFTTQAQLSVKSEKKKSEELQKVQNQLEKHAVGLIRSNKELEEFVYIASHDLQEPLRKVKTFGDRLVQRYDEEIGDLGRDYFRRMESAISRMQALIDGLLIYSRVTSRARPFAPVNLNNIADEVLSDLEIKIEETNAQVHVDDLSTVEADSVQMRQLFQNLIDNALKFCKLGTFPVVEIQSILKFSKREDAGKKFLINEWVREIRVTDNGIGIEGQYREQIFNTFQRLHSNREYAGTGIGLAICRKIVARHEGSIEMESVPGEGSTFIVTLPIMQRKEKEERSAS